MLHAQSQDGYKELLRTIGETVERQGATTAYGPRGAESRIRMLVVGVPNVGKSTIINRLRALGTRIGKSARPPRRLSIGKAECGWHG